MARQLELSQSVGSVRQRIAGRARPRRGLTLLETLLALALSGMIIYGVAMAISLHVRALDTRRTRVEENLVARSVLNMIASDLRATVVKYEPDMSGLMSLPADAVAEAAADALGADGGADTGSGSPGGTDGGGRDGAGGGNTPPSGDAGAPSDETGGMADEGTTEDSSNTTDLASSVAPKPVPGLYGNQYELQIDVSRLPRPDEYRALGASPELGLTDVPSDIKTVTYYVQPPGMTGTEAARDPFTSSGTYYAQTGVTPGGLVRRELDRSVSSWAAENGQVTSVYRAGELIAPEVAAVEFSYFDGTQYLPEWDSDAMQGLPRAVEIVVYVRPRAQPDADQPVVDDLSRSLMEGLVYRLVVTIPAGLASPPPATDEEATEAELEALGL